MVLIPIIFNLHKTFPFKCLQTPKMLTGMTSSLGLPTERPSSYLASVG